MPRNLLGGLYYIPLLLLLILICSNILTFEQQIYKVFENRHKSSEVVQNWKNFDNSCCKRDKKNTQRKSKLLI